MPPAKKSTTAAKKPAKSIANPRVPVSETNLKKAASRLLKSALVSTEIAYIQRTLGSTATQDEVDASVTGVRALPWAKIVEAD